MTKEKFLRDNWKILKFSECIEQLNTGLNPRNHFSLGKGNIKYITAKNLTKSGTLDFSKCDFIDEKAKSIINKRSDIKIGDILFSSRAPIGHCHLIKDEPDYFDIGESIFSIRVNKEIVLPEYLCLYLSSDYFIKLASRNTTGSIIQEIRITDLMNTGIIIPPKSTQKYIAEVLTKLDKKIELNNKINSELENMAKTIYDYWFLQFEFPNDEGKPYKSSGGKMVWSEELKKEIPEGWYNKKIIDIANLYQPKTISEKSLNQKGKYLVFGANGIIGKYDEYNHTNNEIAICCRGASCGKFLMTEPMSWITGNAMVISPLTVEIGKEFIFYSLVYEKICKFITGSAQPQITRENLKNMSILIPNKEILENFEIKAKFIRNKIQNNLKENRELTSLRDYLLPLLMNGQVGFKN